MCGNAAWSHSGLGMQDGSNNFLCPQNRSGGVRIDELGGEDAGDFGVVEGKVTGRFGDAETRHNQAAAGPRHVVEAGVSLQVVTTAGTTANGRTLTVTAIGKMWRQVRIIRCCEFIETSAKSFKQGRRWWECMRRGRQRWPLRR